MWFIAQNTFGSCITWRVLATGVRSGTYSTSGITSTAFNKVVKALAPKAPLWGLLVLGHLEEIISQSSSAQNAKFNDCLLLKVKLTVLIWPKSEASSMRFGLCTASKLALMSTERPLIMLNCFLLYI